MKKFFVVLLRYAPLVLSLAVFCAFAPAVRFGFLELDDPAYVLYNKHLAFDLSNICHQLSFSPIGLYTPLPGLSFMIDYAIAGLQPWCYHLGNIVYHLIGTLALYGILRRLVKKKSTALFFALIWAVSPQRVESVAWVAERKDVLLGACVFGSLYFLLRGKRWWIPALIPALLAPLAKPTGGLLFVAVAALLFVRRRELPWRHWYGLFALPFLGMFLMRSEAKDAVSMAAGSAEPIYFILARTSCNYAEYFVKSIIPLHLNVLYPHFDLSWAAMGAAIAFPLGVVILIWFFLRKRWYDELVFFGLWGLFLLPVAGLFVYGNMNFADRNSYVPAGFLVCALACLWRDLPRGFTKRVPHSVVVAVPLLWMIGTWVHLENFRDTDHYLSSACVREIVNYRAAAALGLRELKRDQIDSAREKIVKLRHPRHRVSRIDGELAALYADYLEGLVCYREKRFGEAVRRLGGVLNSSRLNAIENISDDAHYFLFDTAANLALMQRNKSGSAVLRDALADRYKKIPEVSLLHRALACELRDQLPEAAALYRRVLAANPANSRAAAGLKRVAAAP